MVGTGPAAVPRPSGSLGSGQGAPAGGGDPEMASPSQPGRAAPGRARAVMGRGDLEVVVAPSRAAPAPGARLIPRGALPG